MLTQLYEDEALIKYFIFFTFLIEFYRKM